MLTKQATVADCARNEESDDWMREAAKEIVGFVRGYSDAGGMLGQPRNNGAYVLEYKGVRA